MRSIVWFRRDLRVADNSALYHASKNSKDGIIAVFAITAAQWTEHHDANCKVRFWLDNLRSLSQSLTKLNIPLLVPVVDTFMESVDAVMKIADEHHVRAIYLNRGYEVNESGRDAELQQRCQATEIEFNSFHDRVIVPPREISTKDGRFYSVFTPYRKVWDTRASEYAQPLPKPKKQTAVDIAADSLPDVVAGFDLIDFRDDLWPAGEAEAAKRIKSFAKVIRGYDENRDLPSVRGTSLLSPYLAAGVVSPRQCLAAATEINGGKNSDGAGPTIWISELTWRDFYTHVLIGFPRVSMHMPFKPKTNAINWRNDESDFDAWKNGQTGYPIVDAGMRQLNQTGWMHNRLRMVTAMFLSKHLLIDWKMGEQYFMQKLIDGDLAANNGGWQWSASTGTDAVPYFRIFNPFSQSKRFDTEGEYIKKFCPELVNVPAKALHDAAKLTAALEKFDADYPKFVVDHKQARERVLTEFKSI